MSNFLFKKLAKTIFQYTLQQKYSTAYTNRIEVINPTLLWLCAPSLYKTTEYTQRMPHLITAFRESLRMGYIRQVWKNTLACLNKNLINKSNLKTCVVFIPIKPASRLVGLAWAFGCISLTPILLKIMDRISCRHISDEFLSIRPLNEHQHVFMKNQLTRIYTNERLGQKEMLMRNAGKTVPFTTKRNL